MGGSHHTVVINKQAGICRPVRFSRSVRILLPRGTAIAHRHLAAIAAEGVDVQPAAAGVARVDGEAAGRAGAEQIGEDAFHALFVEFIVLAEAYQVAQQRLAVQPRAGVADLHAAPVRLAGDQAVGFQQMTAQGFADDVAGVGAQDLRAGRVVVHLDVQLVDAFASQFGDGFAAKLLRQHDVDAYRLAGGGGQVVG